MADAFLEEVRALASASHPPAEDTAARLDRELGLLVTDPNAASSLPIDDLARALSDLALHADPDRSELGQSLLFTSLAERLGDTFDAEGARLYDQIFSRVIDRCRRHETGGAVDAGLSRFGVGSAPELLERKDRLVRRPPFPVEDRARVRRAFVLSRVTLGADVAVTGVALQKLERVFPRAERLVFGPAAVSEILAGDGKTRVVDCPYDRRGGLMGRLGSWASLVEAIGTETNALEDGEMVLVDPDSRLTQLGLLPVVEEGAPSFFFESRSMRRPGLETLGELTARWLEEVLGPDEGGPLYPRVARPASDRAWGEAVTRALRSPAGAHVTAVNLGAGNNPRKRMPDPFELDLVRSLLAEGGAVIVDKGVGEEVARVGSILSTLGQEGVRGLELTAGALPPIETLARSRLLVYQGAAGPFADLIAASDLYVGYDSAFQHIAAALSVPVIDIFVDAPNDVFRRRWRPHSQAAVTVVEAAARADGGEALGRVLAAYRESRAAHGSS